MTAAVNRAEENWKLRETKRLEDWWTIFYLIEVDVDKPFRLLGHRNRAFDLIDEPAKNKFSLLAPGKRSWKIDVTSAPLSEVGFSSFSPLSDAVVSNNCCAFACGAGRSKDFLIARLGLNSSWITNEPDVPCAFTEWKRNRKTKRKHGNWQAEDEGG